MNPQESVEELRRRAAALPRPEDAAKALEATVREVASSLRNMAARNRHSVQVRVVAQGNKVRMTIVGQQAQRYRTLAERELEKRKAGAAATVRAQITRKSR